MCNFVTPANVVQHDSSCKSHSLNIEFYHLFIFLIPAVDIELHYVAMALFYTAPAEAVTGRMGRMSECEEVEKRQLRTFHYPSTEQLWSRVMTVSAVPPLCAPIAPVRKSTTLLHFSNSPQVLSFTKDPVEGARQPPQTLILATDRKTSQSWCSARHRLNHTCQIWLWVNKDDTFMS